MGDLKLSTTRANTSTSTWRAFARSRARAQASTVAPEVRTSSTSTTWRPSITARFSGGTFGMVVGHVAPEAFVGGLIALVEEGDSITIDAEARLLRLNVPDDEIARRRAAWQPPAPRYPRGVLAKYAKLVSSSSLGAVTDRQ